MTLKTLVGGLFRGCSDTTLRYCGTESILNLLLELFMEQTYVDCCETVRKFGTKLLSTEYYY